MCTLSENLWSEQLTIGIQSSECYTDFLLLLNSQISCVGVCTGGVWEYFVALALHLTLDSSLTTGPPAC